MKSIRIYDSDQLAALESKKHSSGSLKRGVMPAARIFSGEASVKMWKGINSAKTVRDLRMALYVVCCRLQELEEKVFKRL